VHWSSIGAPDALDKEILAWARTEGATVLTQDLDFGAILAATNADAPSVVLLRAQDSMPAAIGPQLTSLLHQHEAFLQAGALLIFEPGKLRLRILPLRNSGSTDWP
jgi:predicted nuclease of predicted toxin-antitoxin system